MPRAARPKAEPPPPARKAGTTKVRRNVVIDGPHAGTVVCYVPLDYYSIEDARRRANEMLASADLLEAHLKEKS